MHTYIALLRGINSGKNPSQKMDSLRNIFESLGFKNVKTVIASGNVIFESESTSLPTLTKQIEEALYQGTGVRSSTILRTVDEIKELIRLDPFKDLDPDPHNRPHISFLKSKAASANNLLSDGKGYTIVNATDREICFTIDLAGVKTPDVMKMIEQAFGKENVTTRTWGTVLRIAKLLER